MRRCYRMASVYRSSYSCCTSAGEQPKYQAVPILKWSQVLYRGPHVTMRRPQVSFLLYITCLMAPLCAGPPALSA